MKKIILLVALFGIFVLTGCAEKDSESTTDNSIASTGNGDSGTTGLVWNKGNWNDKNWQ